MDDAGGDRRDHASDPQVTLATQTDKSVLASGAMPAVEDVRARR